MENKIALIIGNSDYQDPTLARLQTPSGDVNELAQVLREPGVGSFAQVQTLVNESAPTVMRAIARFFAQKKPDDLLLFYFSGHGIRDDQGHLYLAVKDTEHDLLSGTAIPSAFITSEMDRSRSRRQIIILDCCHSGAFAQGSKGTPGESVGTAAAFEGTGYGRIVLTATDATQYAWQGDQIIGTPENSVFTHYIIEGLQSGHADTDEDGQITVDELYDYVYGQVVNKTPKQTPGKWSYRQQGEIVIAQNPHPTVKPAPLPPELLQTIEDSRSWVREGGVHELERLLQSNQLKVVISALEALRKLAEDDSRRVSGAASAVLQAYTAQSQPTPSPSTQIAPLSTETGQIKKVNERAIVESAVRKPIAEPRLDQSQVAEPTQGRTPTVPPTISTKPQTNRRMVWVALGLMGLLSVLVLCSIVSLAQSLIPNLLSSRTPTIAVIATPGQMGVSSSASSLTVRTVQTTPNALESTSSILSSSESARPTPTWTLTPTATRVVTPTASSTLGPIYNPPTPFDPPNNRIFAARSTILRWNNDRDLKSDEQFEVSVWPENSSERTVIGTTGERIFPIDFGSWKYVGTFGKFLWTVRIKRTDGTGLSNPSQIFSFTLTDLVPPAPPVPTSYKP